MAIVWGVIFREAIAQGEIVLFAEEFTAINSNAFILKTKHFLRIFYSMFKIYITFGIFREKNLSIIAEIFPKLLTLKNAVTQMHSRSCFRTLSSRQHSNGSKTRQKYTTEHFYPTLTSFWHRWIWKTPFLVRFEILGLFVNVLTANAELACHNTRILP